MSDNKEIIDFILVQFKSISKRIAQQEPSLAGELRLLGELLDKIKSSSTQKSLIKGEPLVPKAIVVENGLFEEKSKELSENAIRPVTALRALFSANPEKLFTALQIKQHLIELNSKGELYTRGTDILATTHAAIRVLEKQSFILRIKKGFDVFYQIKK